MTVCERCGQEIEPFVSSPTGYRHRKLLPEQCDTKPPVPKSEEKGAE